MAVEFRVLAYTTGEKIPEDYSLTTFDEAQDHLASVKEACFSAGLVEREEIRLKNGFLRLNPGQLPEVKRTYRGGLCYRLVNKSKSRKELTEEDCLIALAYAAAHDDVDEEVEELVERAGKAILTTRMPFDALGTVLHVCTEWASINMLEKVLKRYPESVDVYILDRDEDTALHNLANNCASISYDDCKRAACLLLGHERVNATKLLSQRNNYGRLTAVCKALMQDEEDVCRALLDAGKEMEEKDKPATSEASKADPHWLTFNAYSRWDADVFFTALHIAVFRGYDDIVAKILAYPGAKELNLTGLQDHKGNTPLHIVAKVGHPEIGSMLLKYSMEINKDGGNYVRSQNKAGKTPLHIASTRGHVEVCEKLLGYGASPALPDKRGKYALTNALTKGHKQVVEKLLDACLPRPQDAKSEAKAELNAINTKSKHSLVNEKFEIGFTPLHVAVAISSEHHIRDLLKAEAWVDSTSDDGRTPLHVATEQYDRRKAFDTLLTETKRDQRNFSDKKKDRQRWINMRDISGRTALHNVVRLSRPSARAQSESREEDQSGAEDQSESAKDQSEGDEEESSAKDQSEISDKETDTELDKDKSEIRCEEERSADKDESEIRCEEEKSADKEILEMVTKLLREGAWVDVQDCDGETALHEAARRQNKGLLCTLLSETKDRNYRQHNRDTWIAMCDFSGETALHEAARTGRLDIVQELLETAKSRDDLLRVRDMKNMTAFDWAAQNQNKPMIDLMMEATDITKEFLMWNLKEHIDPPDHMYLCYKYRVKGNQTSLLQAAVREREVDIARELINRGADVLSLGHNDRRWLAQNLGKKASDQPTSEDTLGRKALVQGVATLLLNPYTETPITIGIFGGWGSGKSSFMLQVEEAMLHMAVKETFRKTPKYNDKESSVLKFSRIGATLRCMVVKAFKQRMIKADEYKQGNRSTSGKSLLAKLKTLKKSLPSANALLAKLKAPQKSVPSADIENQQQMTLKDLDNQSYTCGRADSDNHMTLKDEDDVINRFPMELQSKYHQLFKELALTDRSKLVQYHAESWYKRKVWMNNQMLQDAHLVGYTPAILTLHYNAWQYDNKTEASAGLAVEISHQLESFMTPHQWLRMCWNYSWNSRPKEIFVHLLLPTLLAFVVVCVVLILWKLAPIATKYKVLSFPMGIVGVMWVFFKTSLRVIQPVTQTMLNNAKSIDHRSMLGYQHQVIHDIKFLKDQLCKDAHFGWKILSFLCQLFISNKYFMEGTWISKQHPRLNNFRIVVFIDDLDRCDEKTILELLRATNLILGSCGISALIGVDKGMVQRAITKEFLKDISDKVPDMWVEDTDNKASLEEKGSQVVDNVDIQEEGPRVVVDKKKTQEEKNLKMVGINRYMGNDNKLPYTCELAEKYLQKIIQLPIELPDPSRKHIERFLEGQVGKLQKDKVKDRQEKVSKDEQKQKRTKSFKDEKLQVKDGGDAQSQDETKNGASDRVVFHLLLANYTPLEKDMLKYLCQLSTKERGFPPREWKRFLNYHQLAWTILSQDPSMKNNEFKGWQRKLILWIFICWNWRDQMDVIFEKWHDMISKSSKWRQAQMHSKDKENIDGTSVELCDVIDTYMKSKGWSTKEDANQTRGKQGGEIAPKAWIDLYKTLIDEYDIPMHFIEKFQQFRFYCKLNHLEIDEK